MEGRKEGGREGRKEGGELIVEDESILSIPWYMMTPISIMIYTSGSIESSHMQCS